MKKDTLDTKLEAILRSFVWKQEDHSVMSTISYERSVANAHIDHKQVLKDHIAQLKSLIKSTLLDALPKEKEINQLKGAGKILDKLWDDSIFTMGKLASDRIQKEMVYYFGKNWTTDMYKLIEDENHKIEPVEALQDIKDSLEGIV